MWDPKASLKAYIFVVCISKVMWLCIGYIMGRVILERQAARCAQVNTNNRNECIICLAKQIKSRLDSRFSSHCHIHCHHSSSSYIHLPSSVG